MNKIFEKDLYRYYGDKGEGLFKRILRPKELSYLCLLRKAQSARFLPLKAFYRLRLLLLSRQTMIQIHPHAKIGEGFYIGHLGRIIVNPDAQIGKNVNVATGVTIGQENRGARKGSPKIGSDCWIGTNAVIVGNVTIGNDVLIAPLSFVNFDVPDHSIVVGNPARIIPKEHATRDYISNRV